MYRKNCMACGGIFYHGAGEAWKTLCLPCWKRKKAKETDGEHRYAPSGSSKERVVKESIPPDMLDRLIRLCHPDRHGNSAASNEATAWLLSQRRKERP